MFRRILGISKLEKRIARLEKAVSDLQKKHSPKKETIAKDMRRILKALDKDMTTRELASLLNKHRSWISLLLNKLEREGRVIEVDKRGREIVYTKI